MKYNQPYGVSDPNAPYINGDPSVGRAGSIPPAASIEFPQREIVNLITDAGIPTPPDNADLHQLGKAVQSGQLNYKPDTGLANFYAATMAPNPGSYYGGLTAILRIANNNTGPAVLNLNGIGNVPICKGDGSDVGPGDIIAGALVCFVYDDIRDKFQIVWRTLIGAGPEAPGWIFLSAPQTLYVNDATGNDAWDGTVAAYTTGTHGPFKTCQRACDEYRKWNMNGFWVGIHVAPGTYAPFHCWDVNGSGYVYWFGDTVNNPPNVHINAASGGIAIQCDLGVQQFDGFRISSAGNHVTTGMPGWGITGGGPVYLNKIYFGACPGGHMLSSTGNGYIGINGPITLAGNGPYVAGCDGGRFHLNSATPPLLTIVGTVAVVSGFYLAFNLGVMTGPWGTITNKAGVTGPRYRVEGNAVINVNGAGETYLPGDVAGTKAFGGQYY